MKKKMRAAVICLGWLSAWFALGMGLEAGSGGTWASGESSSSNVKRPPRQLLYSPYLFPGNYQAGFPSSSNLSPLSSFWSNLHSVPALHKSGLNGQSSLQLPSHGRDQGLAGIATLNPTKENEFRGQVQYLAAVGQTEGKLDGLSGGNVELNSAGNSAIILPYSGVEHGNVWNFDERNYGDESLLGYYFPFSNFGNVQYGPRGGGGVGEGGQGGSGPTGFQRGHVEGRPGMEGGSGRVPYTSSSGLGFNRAHVEWRPAGGPYRAVGGEGGHGGEEASSFDRGAVEAVPDFIDENDRGFGADNRAVGGNFKVVCYFANWASYREGKGAFLPENINATLCSHVIYAFATFDKALTTIAPSDEATDVTNNFYRRTVALKQVNPGLKVLLSVGGWADSGDDKYSNLAHSPDARRKFASESVKFLGKYGFDGLAIDWHYPKCWQSNCDAGPGSDSTAFGDLLRELSGQLKPRGLLLAATLSGYKEVIDEAYHVPTINQYLDLMNIMTYDYHGSWESNTGHIAPLFHLSSAALDKYPHYNANYTMEYYVALGADRSKLIMGIPMYGQTFELRDRSSTGIGDPALGAGKPGEFTKQPGMLAYYEICSRVKAGWTVKRDRTASMGPVAYSENQWVGYDDPDFVARKARYIKGSGYGGAFVWTLDLDDFNNMCCHGSMPLLKTIAFELLRVPFRRETSCAQPSFPTPPTTPMLTTTTTMEPAQEHWTTTTRPPWSQITTTRTTTTTGSTPPSWVTDGPFIPDSGSSLNRCNSSAFVPLAARDDCETYYQCIFDTVVKRKCSKGLHYNSETDMCDWPDNARCNRDSESILVQQSTPSSAWGESATRPPSGGANRECNNGEYLPAEDCNQYYLCTLGRKMMQRCPAGLHWNREQRLCDWPSSANCVGNPNKIQFPTMPIQVPGWQQIQQPGVSIRERCKEGSFFPSDRDCGTYYVCVHGERMEFHCQGGLYWNQGANICDWPSSAGCTLGGPSDPDMGYPEQGTPAPTFPPMTVGTTMRPQTTYRPPPTQAQPLVTRPPANNRPTRPPPPWQQTTDEPMGTNTDLGPVVTGQDTPVQSDFMIVCYFTNWALYRPDGYKYYPSTINPNLCTHIVYGFAVLNPSTLLVKIHDPWADLDYGQEGFYKAVARYKEMGIKVSIALGGWNDSEGDKYSRLVNDARARARFTENILEFIQKYNFDGLDLDWEYPKCWQVDCSKGPVSDKSGFSAWVRELKEAFEPYGYLLSAAVSPSKMVIDEGYDVPSLSRYLDWIAVMTYDYHGQWDKKTGHVAPLFVHEEDDNVFFNSNYTINYWINKGADRRKIVMGMPMYGQAFTLDDPRYNGLNAPASKAGNAGPVTRQAGFLSYFEICELVLKKGFNLVRDESGAMGPYAYKGNQWVSFDDVDTIRRKAEFIRSMDIGGGMIWALDLDDFRGKCGQGSYPLLTTIKNVLSSPRGEAILVSEPSNLAPQQTGNNNRPVNGNRPAVTTTTRRPPIVDSVTQGNNNAFVNQRPPSESFTGEEAIENDVCSDEPFRPHAKDCNKYYQCIYGRYIEQRCPPGTYWNQNRCDWKCGQPVPTMKPQQSNEKPKPVGTTQRPSVAATTRTTTMRTTTTTRSTTKRPPPPNQPSNPQPPAPSTPAPESGSYPSTSAPGNYNCPKAPPKGQYDWEPATATETNTATPLDVPKSDYMVVCYFTNWAWYRPGTGRYKPSDIDFNLCTHIAYGFAVLDGSNNIIKPHDGWADLENKFYRQVTALKARGLKVVLAIGGWNDSAGDKYSKLVNNPAARRKFITHVIEFIEKHCFDGLDLDWEYPKCWQVDCKKGPASDKQAFADFVRELSEAFKPRGLLLSSAVSPSKMVVDEGYDVPTISRYMDWISVMTYDYHGQWDKKTGHVAPLYLHEEADNAFFNTNYTINYWIDQGADRKKIVLGMPMYGQSFTLVNPSDNGLNAKSSGGGTAGEYTRQSGFLAYYEICRNILTNGWEVVQDDSGAIGPYAYKGNQWASFDDMNMIKRKSQYVKDMKLGGGMIWALDLDDFRGSCGCGRHPLLKTINRELRNYRDSENFGKGRSEVRLQFPVANAQLDYNVPFINLL